MSDDQIKKGLGWIEKQESTFSRPDLWGDESDGLKAVAAAYAEQKKEIERLEVYEGQCQKAQRLLKAHFLHKTDVIATHNITAGVIEIIGEIDRLTQRIADNNQRYTSCVVSKETEIEQLKKHLSCGLCGKIETPELYILHLCEDCTHQGYSTVPEESFTMMREIERLRAVNAQLSAYYKYMEGIINTTPPPEIANAINTLRARTQMEAEPLNGE